MNAAVFPEPASPTMSFPSTVERQCYVVSWWPLELAYTAQCSYRLSLRKIHRGMRSADLHEILLVHILQVGFIVSACRTLFIFVFLFSVEMLSIFRMTFP
jgi:hypothetical protein